MLAFVVVHASHPAERVEVEANVLYSIQILRQDEVPVVFYRTKGVDGFLVDRAYVLNKLSYGLDETD